MYGSNQDEASQWMPAVSRRGGLPGQPKNSIEFSSLDFIGQTSR